MDKVFIVCAGWEHEGHLELVAFGDKGLADKFKVLCDEHQEEEPDVGVSYASWEDEHPAKPYLPNNDTLYGAEGFYISTISFVA